MKYSNVNVKVSLTNQLAEYLRANGYNIRWHVDDHIDPHTSEGPEKGTITMVPDFPANPSYIVRLNDSKRNPDDIVVPAFTLQLIGSPQIGRRRGIGHKDFDYSRTIIVDGFADNAIQQEQLANLLYEWVGLGDKSLEVWDYSTDPNSPTQLPDVTVDIHSIPPSVHWKDLIGEVGTVRHYVKLHFVINYVE